MKQRDRDLIERVVGRRHVEALLRDVGGIAPTRLTPDDKARIRRLIAGEEGACFTGKGLRYDFHLVDVAARWLRMAARR